jgi:hypothetical protein
MEGVLEWEADDLTAPFTSKKLEFVVSEQEAYPLQMVAHLDNSSFQINHQTTYPPSRSIFQRHA